jgi:hypothetical protein
VLALLIGAQAKHPGSCSLPEKQILKYNASHKYQLIWIAIAFWV